MSSKLPSPKEHATEAEIEAAISALTLAELEQLGNVAEFYARALSARGAGISGDDLVQEAIIRTCTGKRRWPTSVRFITYLLATVRSIASAAMKKLKDQRLTALDPSEDEIGNELAARLIPDLGHHARVVAETERIEQLFADDERVLLLMEGLKDGMLGPALQVALKLSKTEYETAMKRLRRGARRKE